MGLFFHHQQDKFHYYLHLFGRNPSKTHKAIVSVMAKDGSIVNTPHLLINNRESIGNIINLNASVRRIDADSFGFQTHFDISWDSIVNKARFLPDDISFTSQDLHIAQRIKEASFVGDRKIILLPTSFWMLSEFAVPGYIYCLSANTPCSDTTITLDGTQYPMKNGVAEVVFRMPPSTMAVISFADKSTAAVAYPYKGKMFFWDESKKNLSLQTLIPLERIVIDCYRKGEWLFSDVVSSEGSINLPKRYETCDRIQASFDSNNPGRSFAVFTTHTHGNTNVSDPYYAEFANNLALFGPHHQKIFSRIYQRSSFLPLIHLYDGREQEKLFQEKHRETLASLWWGIALVLMAGIFFFTFSVFREIEVVTDEEGELLTHSLNRQIASLAGITILLILFAIGFLYLFKHMA